MSDLVNKKKQFEKNDKKSFKWLLLVAVLAVAGIGSYLLTSGTKASNAGTVQAVNGYVTLSAEEVGDGQAHFFDFESEKGSVRFFVLKSRDGVIRAAFDACDVCYRAQKGYRQEGSVMVCNNCNQQFRSEMINEVKGGCNPAPLRRTLENGQLRIAAADIASGAWYFGSGK